MICFCCFVSFDTGAGVVRLFVIAAAVVVSVAVVVAVCRWLPIAGCVACR